jgi:hypothetical protein
MNRLTAAVEAEIALIRRAIHEAKRSRVTARIVAISGVFARIFRSDAAVPKDTLTRRQRGVYAWDARGNFVPLPKGGGGATHSGAYSTISPAQHRRGSGTSNQHRSG